MNGTSPDKPYLKFAKYLAGYDPKKPISAKQETEIWSCMMNAVIGVAMLVVASGLVYVASTDPAAVTNRMYVYSVLIIIPILFAAYMMVPTFGSKPSGTKLIGYALVVSAFFIVSYFLMKNMSMKEIVFANYFIIALGIGVAILLAAIMSKVSFRYLMSLEGWPGFVAKLILYIPCLISELLFASIDAMPNIYAKIGLILVYIYALLAIVYNIIDAVSPGLLRFGLPDWLKERSYLKTLYKADTYNLNTIRQYDITGLDELGLDSSTRTKNYTISAWVYISDNSQVSDNNNPVTSSILALRKASEAKTNMGSPAVRYNSGKLKIAVSNFSQNPPIKTVDILPQRWNHLVFVYSDNVAHFYLNSKLMFSEPLTNYLPTYSFSDELVSGDDSVKIMGKIGGVSYVPTTYDALQIVGIYNATRGFYV
jgi:hypothetical protein